MSGERDTKRDTFRLRGDEGRNGSDTDGEGGGYGRQERVWSHASSGDGGNLYDTSRQGYVEHNPSVLKGDLIRKEDDGLRGFQQDLVEQLAIDRETAKK